MVPKTLDSTSGGQLTVEYGPEPFNYYGRAALNRVSFLRDDYAFMHGAINHPSTRFLPLKDLAPPLVSSPGGEQQAEPEAWNAPRPPKYELKFLTRQSKGVEQFLGNPFEVAEETQIKEWDSTRDAVGVKDRPLVVFLGLDETAEDDQAFSYVKGGTDPDAETYKGVPYFVIDLGPTYIKSEALKTKAEAILDGPELADVSYKISPMSARLSATEAAIYAQARMYTDWNERNRFCGGCGKPTMSTNAGCKLACPAQDAGVDQPHCPTRGRISNLSFPRTDSSIIAAVVNFEGTKMLLGRNKRFPAGFFSCLAGFLEPAETIEDCVRREIWEESGVKVGRVVIHSTQPWPFPANLMLGCIAQVKDASEEAHRIHLGHDPELEECKWYDFDELRAILPFASHDIMFERPKALKDGEPQLPMREAIAYTLIEAVLNGRVRGIQTK